MKNNLIFSLSFLLTLNACVTNGLAAQTPSERIAQKISEHYTADGPGVAVLVSKGDQILYRKGYGMANLELGLPVKPEHVFRIGSITKQFTALAILKLAEAGKLSLDDEITKFIPGFPTHGHRITVENLLNHTSGIKSYTGMHQWNDEVRRRDFSVDSLINYFKNEPMDFAPGEDWSYNNSGYILLGFIIEKTSGMTYADYVEQTFFKPLGMKNSHYDRTEAIVPNRIPGYQKDGDDYENAAYLSMTQPYAAGSIISTVDDLRTWYRAVAAGKVVSKTSLEKALAPTQLKNGRTVEYGFGLSTGVVQGSVSYGHNGGINGFLSSSVYLPKEDIFAVLLTNCDCSELGSLDAEFAAIALGKPYEWKEVALEAGKLEEYQAVYASEFNGERTIKVKDGSLFSQVSGGGTYRLIPTGKDRFHVENSLTDLQFNRDGKGNIVSVISTSRNQPVEWEKTDKAITVRESIQLPEAVLHKYAGTYQLFPDFALVIQVEDQKLTAEPTGQPKVVLLAESETKFYIEEVDAQIEFVKNDAGEVEKLILHQGGRQMEGLKK